MPQIPSTKKIRTHSDEDAARRADDAVEKALLKKAKGYSYTQEDSCKCKTVEYDEHGKKVREDEVLRVIEVKKHMPPDYDSILFWLRSRRPQAWGESVQNAGVPIIDDVPNAPILSADEMASLVEHNEDNAPA